MNPSKGRKQRIVPPFTTALKRQQKNPKMASSPFPIDSSCEASSYFDRLWSNGRFVRRFFILSERATVDKKRGKNNEKIGLP